jgi:vancomycin resistance protein YoaR
MATTQKPAPRKSMPAKKAAVKKAAVKKATPPVKAPAKAPVKQAAPKPAPVEVKVKHKLVRDSFTIPKAEYVVLEGLKQRAADLKRPTKKSELIRAGIAALKKMGDKEFLAAVGDVPSLKTGRPKLAEAKKA